MLMIPTTVKSSTIEGIGLFAERKISRSEVVWHFQEGFDFVVSFAMMQTLPQPARDFLQRYCYPDDRDPAAGYVVEPDNARFINHNAQNPNILCNMTECIALRDIEAGEEITCDYGRYAPGYKPGSIDYPIADSSGNP